MNFIRDSQNWLKLVWKIKFIIKSTISGIVVNIIRETESEQSTCIFVCLCRARRLRERPGTSVEAVGYNRETKETGIETRGAESRARGGTSCWNGEVAGMDVHRRYRTILSF